MPTEPPTTPGQLAITAMVFLALSAVCFVGFAITALHALAARPAPAPAPLNATPRKDQT